MDGVETALLLITENEGTITPYGVVYDNGMELSLIYQGRNFPEYLYEEGLMTVSLQSIHASDDSSEAVWLYLPAPERQIARMLCRGGLESEEFAKLEIQINGCGFCGTSPLCTPTTPNCWSGWDRRWRREMLYLCLVPPAAPLVPTCTLRCVSTENARTRDTICPHDWRRKRTWSIWKKQRSQRSRRSRS